MKKIITIIAVSVIHFLVCYGLIVAGLITTMDHSVYDKHGGLKSSRKKGSSPFIVRIINDTDRTNPKLLVW